MLRSFTRAAAVLHMSQPARTAKIKKGALRFRLLSDRRRMERNLLPMPERVLNLNTVQFDVRTRPLERRGVDADRCAAVSLLQPPASCLPREGARLVRSVVFLLWPTACPIRLQRRSF